MDADLVSISNQDEMDFVLSISYELIIITDNSCGSGWAIGLGACLSTCISRKTVIQKLD